MDVKDITSQDREAFNNIVDHPLQSYEWGEFRKKTGVKVIRSRFAGQLTIHKIPFIPFNIGYLPKGPMPTKKMIDELKEIGKRENCIFIQLEPNIQKNNWKLEIGNWKLQPATHPLFTKYTFVLDLTKNEQELLAGMHPKTRYNIKVAQKHGVEVVEDNSDEAFEIYLRLTAETTKRQRFYAHNERYHRLMWEALKNQKSKIKNQNLDMNKLTAHLFLAKYKGQTLVAWILFVFKDTLYYPYGASSDKYREVMTSNLMMWEAIRFGKKMGCTTFDLWGSLGPNPAKTDSWYGFHRFKEGYDGKLVEFVGSFDLVINPLLYQLYKISDKLRWYFLNLIRV